LKNLQIKDHGKNKGHSNNFWSFCARALAIAMNPFILLTMGFLLILVSPYIENRDIYEKEQP